MRWFWGIVAAVVLIAAGGVAGYVIASHRDAPVAVPPAGSRVVFFGDSWTAGYWSDPLTGGFAYLTANVFGWDAVVLGEAGTGFIQKGPNPPEDESYPTRAKTLPIDEDVPLVILEGSINDTTLNEATTSNPTVDRLRFAVESTLASLRRAYPNARIIALGPTGGDPVPELDAMLRQIYAAENVSYIDAVDWITEDMPWALGDPYHPSSRGHAYFAGRLVDALQAVYSP
ncbi:SGNH/GDSL hydrolase family protein [Microbacterium sp. SORGH_AS_0862]|uniref:SGNH/GDSL hydrolase family protein n=1 Tax=Microbacterium sp. SORGH_AS_0862 TaxID=3041789 RepID=UPI002790680B|nr:SGNH/GDSL hydrolase family protein [Microbacterium sp. SORGH_AS_0862]MDQ1206134.1 lysophospholipase L1-like esterase [Microbacterium sp. SORGH_AS_0862]